jgi:hypothetical protein
VATKKRHKKAKRISNRQAKTFPKKQKIEILRPKLQADFIKGFEKVKSPAGEPAGEIKMSAVILKIAEPLIKLCGGNENRIQSTIAFSVAVWNMSMTPEDQQEDFQNKIIEQIFPTGGDAEDIGSFVYMIDLLLERKKSYFPDIHKVIVGHHLNINGDDINLDVASAFLKEH